MKKNLLVLAFFVFLTQSSFAQFSYGAKAGLNFSASGNIKELMTDFSSVETAKGNVSGFFVGFYTEIELLFFYLRPELQFNKYETTFDNLEVGQSRLELPVSAGFKILPVLSVFAGPTLRYNFSPTVMNYSIDTIESDTTLGIHFGVRGHIGPLGLDVRYDRGLNSNEVQLLDNQNVNFGKVDIRPNVWSLGLSYAF